MIRVNGVDIEGSTSLPVTAADELLDGAAPDRFFTTADDGRGQLSTFAATRGLLGLTTTPPLTGSTGWTLRNGSGTAAITSSVARLTLASGAAPGGWSNQPGASYPHALTGRPPHFAVDAVARLAALTGGDSSDVYLSFGLRTGAGATADGFLLNLRGDGGAIFGYAEAIGSGGVIGSGTIARGTLAGGQFWARVVLTSDGVMFYVGTGSGGAEPTSWTTIGTSATLTSVTAASIGALTFAVDAGGGGSPTNITADWNSISARLVGLGAL